VAPARRVGKFTRKISEIARYDPVKTGYNLLYSRDLGFFTAMVTTEKSGVRRPMTYLELSAELRVRMASGALQPGDRLPSFTAMQEEFGAASNTVNRALMDLEQSGLILREKRRGVFVAPPRSRPRHGVVGFAGLDFERGQSPYWYRLLAGIQQTAHAAETELLLLRPGVPMREHILDGVLIYGDTQISSLSEGVGCLPKVGLMEIRTEFPFVAADEEAATYDLVSNLLSLGHRRIAYLGLLEAETIKTRLRGYERALYDAGVRPEAAWLRNLEFMGREFRDMGAFSMWQWLAHGWRDTGCTAVVAQNDATALGIMDVLAQRGMKVPGDVSVVGFDGIAKSTPGSPELSTVKVPLEEIGKSAMTALLKWIEGDAMPPAATFLEYEFEPGGTIAVPSR